MQKKEIYRHILYIIIYIYIYKILYISIYILLFIITYHYIKNILLSIIKLLKFYKHLQKMKTHITFCRN